MLKLNCLITYYTYSGNTEEVAEIIRDTLEGNGSKVTMNIMGIGQQVNPEDYDIVFFGAFTWGYGRVPDEIKDFISEVGYKPDNMAIFGTGDTQFGGDEMFCMAVDKLVNFYHSKWEGLKIEQSPRGMQEVLVERWTKSIIRDIREREYEKAI